MVYAGIAHRMRHERRTQSQKRPKNHHASSLRFLHYNSPYELYDGFGFVDTAELDQLVAQIGEEIIARLRLPAPVAVEGLNIPDLVCPGCTQRCPQTCAHKTKEILAAGADRITASDRLTDVDQSLAPHIDYTLLRPEATRDDVLRACREARRFGFASVCVNPYWLSLAVHELAGSSQKASTVIGFPLGATSTGAKMAEAASALRVGAEELNVVINTGALRSGDYDAVKCDLEAVTALSREAGAMVQVILETSLLDDSQKAIACTLARMAGAHFVKTSTGFGPSGATVHDVVLMRRVIGPPAAGARSLEDLRRPGGQGATRIGAAASVRIVEAAAA